MFNKAIFETTLTSDTANRLFTDINDMYTPDKSFLATLRALLHKRLPQNESVCLRCHEVNYTAQEIANASVTGCMSWFIPDSVDNANAQEYGIHIIHATQPDAGEKILATVKAHAGPGKRHLGNYTRRDDLHVFYARKAKALFYTDDADKNTVIFTGKMELKHFHALQMMIPRYLLGLFTDIPLTEAETALLKSTGSKSAVEYETLIELFAKDLDLRAELIRIKLAGFETIYERVRADEIREEIQRHQDTYESHLTAIRDVSHKINESRYMLAGLESTINGRSGDSELMEYFMCNKNLAIAGVHGTAITFVAHGYADVYDEAAFEQYVGNHSGFLYGNLNPAISKSQMELLYRAIFSEGRYKLRLCAAYKADMRNGLRAVSHYTFPPESRNYLPNPHIQRHGCVGSYGGLFNEYMHRGDYIGAIEQAVVSGRNLNFYDSTVMAVFAGILSRATMSCIEKPDGVLLTPKEAIKELEGGAVCPDL